LAAPVTSRALWLALLAAGGAHAWPADLYVDLEAGAEKFHRLAAVGWVEVEDPSVATAEIMESGELLLTGKVPGRTLLLLYAEGKIAVWRLRVAVKGARPRAEPEGAALAAARAACPGLKVDGPSLSVVVKDDRCRVALLALFKTDAFSARDLELTFEVPPLQAQLSAIQAGLGVDARYVGAGLVLSGKLPQGDHRRALWSVFQRSVGRVALEDRVEISSEQDGGS
jgi:hypothetical protein